MTDGWRDARIAALTEALRNLASTHQDITRNPTRCEWCERAWSGHTPRCPVGHALRVLEGR